MTWFTDWWGGLALFEQIMFCVAIPATVILLIQVIMLIFGFGHDGTGLNPSDTSGIDGFDGGPDFGGADVNGDGVIDSADLNISDGSSPGDLGTMNFFTVQGIITFLCVFGWVGEVSYILWGVPAVSIAAGLVLGAVGMFGVAKLLSASRKLAQNGTLNVNNLLGASGTVYLVIPADGENSGKVSIASGERLVEFDAITDSGEQLPDGTPIRVIDIRSGNLLVVEKI
ncbi:MAG: NfeD family protein [Ruminiclostridium sp.]|nr:NfeD family protein [Ruminiclostridium sp.]